MATGAVGGGGAAAAAAAAAAAGGGDVGRVWWALGKYRVWAFGKYVAAYGVDAISAAFRHAEELGREVRTRFQVDTWDADALDDVLRRMGRKYDSEFKFVTAANESVFYESWRTVADGDWHWDESASPDNLKDKLTASELCSPPPSIPIAPHRSDSELGASWEHVELDRVVRTIASLYVCVHVRATGGSWRPCELAVRYRGAIANMFELCLDRCLDRCNPQHIARAHAILALPIALAHPIANTFNDRTIPCITVFGKTCRTAIPSLVRALVDRCRRARQPPTVSAPPCLRVQSDAGAPILSSDGTGCGDDQHPLVGGHGGDDLFRHAETLLTQMMLQETRPYRDVCDENRWWRDPTGVVSYVCSESVARSDGSGLDLFATFADLGATGAALAQGSDPCVQDNAHWPPVAVDWDRAVPVVKGSVGAVRTVLLGALSEVIGVISHKTPPIVRCDLSPIQVEVGIFRHALERIHAYALALPNSTRAAIPVLPDPLYEIIADYALRRRFSTQHRRQLLMCV